MTDMNFTPAVRAYAVGLLTFIYTANYVDRQIVAILLQSIKLDMGLSDTQLGLLSGLAFAIFYATLGIPIAYLADRMSRKKIIIVSLSLFSVMTIICGYAQNFAQLLLARIGVGVARPAPARLHAMIADMYAPNERATPLAIFALDQYRPADRVSGRWMGEPSLWLAHRLSGCRPARPVTGRCCHVHLARSAARTERRA